MHLRVTVPELTIEKRTALIKNLTETVWNIVHLPEEVKNLVTVHLDIYGKNVMGRGGKIVANGELPVYHMDLYAPILNVDQKRELGVHLTNAICDTLALDGDRRKVVSVTVHQFSPENSVIGGRLIADLTLV